MVTNATIQVTRYKLNAKIAMLDPSATLSITDWLINLRAAAGLEFRMCFLTAAELE